MRIAVMGTGGVGGYFGARLAQAGHDVAFIARGAHLAALRARGLRVESAGGNVELPEIVATDDPSSLAPVEVVMFCVKLWDVEAAAPQVAPLVARGGVVIAFQNGIDSHAILARVLGASRVLGGVAYIAAAILAPGVVVHTGTMARLRVGAFDEALTGRAKAFVHACTQAGIDAELAADIRRALWEKFAFLSALSGVTALSRQPVGFVRAENVALSDDFLSRQTRALDGLPADMRSSMQNDLLAGNRLEAPWLCGRVAELSAKAGIAAPVSATIYAGLKPYVDGAPH